MGWRWPGSKRRKRGRQPLGQLRHTQQSGGLLGDVTHRFDVSAGAANAALFAVAMLACHDPALQQQLEAFRTRQTAAARAMTLPLTNAAGSAAA